MSSREQVIVLTSELTLPEAIAASREAGCTLERVLASAAFEWVDDGSWRATATFVAL